MSGESLSKASQAILKRAIVQPEWMLDHEDIIFQEVLGRNHCVEELVGEFVHGGITRQVLLKTIGISCDRTDLKRFMKEVRLLRSLHHENIGQIYGVALHYSPIILVLEFFPTSLLMHLKRNRGRSSATEKRRFVCEAAAGLAYLADLRCVHRDIAARNCMLDDSRVVKISGFSLCEPVNEMHDDPSNIPIAVKWQHLKYWKIVVIV
ncbi:hypothetical protein KIN20_027662 [Parelaphostrongylus tenuis]|uniref:Protein kinase domain-containing protein n=1 Tax=Parelaphostrongylus tenuis TaxID=148309 RepID=A0AAD5QZN4_PARTN|nr:hypothetical protein KIN20_027662 [Parelaphostrongylus tenuis]